MTSEAGAPLEGSLSRRIIRVQFGTYGGAGSREQKLTRIADVDYTLGGVRYHFVRQFVFPSGMATHGDSGAVAVWQRHNTVVHPVFLLLSESAPGSAAA